MLCSDAKRIPRTIDARFSPQRVDLIAQTRKLWASGSEITYHLSSPRSDHEADEVRRGFDAWAEICNLRFTETARGRAQIRVAFMEGDGAWSYVGRDILSIPFPRPTMNFGWPVADDFDTILHEIGHAIGLEHEHQNPQGGLVWNRQAVINWLSGPPNNWDRATIERNVFSKVQGPAIGSTFDPDSIMQYPFPAGMISQPVEYAAGIDPRPGLSDLDRIWAAKAYPGADDSSEMHLELHTPAAVSLKPGSEQFFEFTAPHSSKFTFNTLGDADTVLAVFDEENRFIGGDDDAGIFRNSRVTLRLHMNQTVQIRLRVIADDHGTVWLIARPKELAQAA